MALLTTGWIENTEVLGVRPSSTLAVRINNTEPVNAAVRINGFYWNGTNKIEYVLDLLTLAPKEIAYSDYYAKFDNFEFQVITNTDAIEISAYGKDAAGNRSVSYSMLPAELFQMGMDGISGAPGKSIPSALNRIYIPNSGSNQVTVIDETTNSLMGDVIVGAGPFGIGVNPLTNRIYVVNFVSNNVSVIDGNTNTLITTIIVGTNPVGVGVNPNTNRIYVTNRGSHNISVIDGFTHVVIATILVGTSPEGLTINSATNRIYITNHGSNTVSVINGSTHTVIATVDVQV